MGEEEQLIVRVVPSIGDVDADKWDACASPEGRPYNPFTSHAFLYALERSQCATPYEGWAPQHLCLESGDGTLLGCMPNYLKSNSYGEYIFDHGWADAFESAGGHYYPKLQSAVPFTPAQGRRLLVAPGPQEAHFEKLLASAAIELTDRLQASSLHITFLSEGEWNRLGDLGFLQRKAQQFHWKNDGYKDFDDFLASLASRKRKMIRRERREATVSDIEIELLTGSSLKEVHWDHFFEFYEDTGSRKWGSPYLNREFFSCINEAMADDILLILCKRDGDYIAGALNLIGGDTLYGRYWGCTEHHNFLHFEVCYYQAIDFAIEKGLEYVEAGAQGPHKLARGYMPTTMYSVHYIANESFRNAVADFLNRERRHVEFEQNALSAHSPFAEVSNRLSTPGKRQS